MGAQKDVVAVDSGATGRRLLAFKGVVLREAPLFVLALILLRLAFHPMGESFCSRSFPWCRRNYHRPRFVTKSNAVDEPLRAAPERKGWGRQLKAFVPKYHPSGILVSRPSISHMELWKGESGLCGSLIQSERVTEDELDKQAGDDGVSKGACRMGPDIAMTKHDFMPNPASVSSTRHPVIRRNTGDTPCQTPLT